MSTNPLRIFLEGPPRVGKTTVVDRTASSLVAAGVPVGGFVTRELLESGRRAGFAVEEIGGEPTVMAHVGLEGDVRVGRYTVSAPAFERVALPALTRARGRRGVVVVDEIGRMELASAAFVTALGELLDGDQPVLATVQVHPHPVTDALKARPDVELIQVTPGNREELVSSLAARLAAVAPQRHPPRTS